MSANLTPALPGAPAGALASMAPGASRVPATRPADAAPPADGGAQLARLVAALGRYKWLILGLGAAGLAGGVVASRFVTPKYSVQSSFLITARMSGATSGRDLGPISPRSALTAQGWMDLLRTSVIADSVVMKLALYLEPERPADMAPLRDFHLNTQAQRFVPGEFTFKTTGPRYTLRDKLGFVNEQGIIGDSVGREIGFAWAPTRAVLGSRDREVRFTVRTPRETASEILRRMQVGLATGSDIIVMRLTGTAQQKPAETLNAWGDQFVRIATDLKTEEVTRSAKALEDQRAEAAQRLAAAEQAFQKFRIGTIALPSDALAIRGGAGVGAQADPVMQNFYASKYQLETVHRDREQLARVAAGLNPTRVPIEAILSVPSVASDPGALPLREALGELQKREAEYRALTQTYTDSAPEVRPRLAPLRAVRARSVQETNAYLAQLRQREAQLGGVVGKSTAELQAIPARTTEQERLRRDYEAQQALFQMLDSRYQEAQLALRSMTPDVRVFDRAVMPLMPTNDTAGKLIAFGLVAGLGAGLGLALLLDRLDRRFRYPMQATHELGLQILGVVPEIDQRRPQTPEQVAQIVEAFRSIRMNTRYAVMPSERVALTITSPGASDGKSLIASNLALSFAEGGWRTALVDGDLRRGQLHETFDLESGPGLVEYLEGTSLLGEIIQPTRHDNLSLVATGTKHRRGPELLATSRMQQLIAALSGEFDAVIVDTPPLGAGTDAYAVGTATRHMAIVLRRATTDLRMAKAKLDVLDQLPVDVIGVVLNEVQVGAAMYQFMSYDPDYALVEANEPKTQQLPAGARE